MIGPILRALAVLAIALSAPASAQQARAPRIWDIPFGTHVGDLPVAEFVDAACGTNGGPAGLPLAGFTNYARCMPEASGLREVWFIYDDTREYIGLALRNALIRSATTLLDQPVILSYLIDADGLVQGLRIVTDPRAPASLRLAAHEVALVFKARYDLAESDCADISAGAGEVPIDSVFFKERCVREAGGLRVVVEQRFFYKPGQQVVEPGMRRDTTNEFESFARLDVVQMHPAPARLSTPTTATAAAADGGDRRATFLAGHSRDCAGCDLRGADLRRRELGDANLAGANLERAILHHANLRRANLAGANLRQANLNRVNLGFANLRDADLDEALLFQVEASRADFGGATFRNARMGRGNFALAKLDGANLAGADLGEARLNDASLVRASLNGAFMPLAVLFRADLSDITADGAMMEKAGLRDANLARASLRGSDLFGADLSGANMAEANFTGARLLSANLTEANQTGTVFTGATMPDNSLHR